MKKKPPGPVATARIPENVERVREAVVRSSTRSAWRHSVELGMSENTVRRILHKDLGFHPYKMMIVQTLNEGHYQQRSAFAELMLESIEENEDAIIMTSDEAHFHLNGSVNKQNFHKIPMKCTKDRCTARKWRFGVLLVKLASLVRTFLRKMGLPRL